MTANSAKLRGRSPVKHKAAPLLLGEERLRLVIGVVPAMIAYVDAQERFVYCNRAYQETFKLTGKKIIGCSVSEVFGKKTYGSIRTEINQVLSGQKVRYE